MNFSHGSIVLAYIDPGSGAMLLQWIIAGVIGVSFYFRRFVGKIMQRVFRKGPKSDKKDSEASSGKQS